jgi:hypothetical protein
MTWRAVFARLSTTAEVFDLLAQNYVEDDDEMFRFQYSQVGRCRLT